MPSSAPSALGALFPEACFLQGSRTLGCSKSSGMTALQALTGLVGSSSGFRAGSGAGRG